MMQSTMQDFPLNVGMIFRHGRALHGESEVVTFEGDDSRRATFEEVAERVERLAVGLRGLGIEAGDRVGTFMWNTQEHLEAYFAVPMQGAVLHTLNIRLFPEQLAYIVNHGGDRVIIVDDVLAPMLARVAAELETVECYVIVGDGDISAARGGRARLGRVRELRRAPRRSRSRGLRLPRSRRVGRGGDVLHERYDRQPEGRRLLAPLDVHAHHRHPDRCGHSVHVERPPPADRPDVPRQRVGRALRRVDGWCRPVDAGPLPPGRAAREVHRRERPTTHVRGADHLGRPLALLGGPRRRLLVARADHVRRCGGAARPDGGVPGPVRHPHDPGLGHDRDQPGGGDVAPTAGRAARHQGGDGLAIAHWPAAARCRAAHRRRRRHRAAVGRRGGGGDPVPGLVDHRLVLRRSRAREVRRRLVAHRRHRQRHAQRLREDLRPLEGRHQVGRGVDLVGRARGSSHGAPRRRRSRGDRGARRPLGRATRSPAWCGATARTRARPTSASSSATHVAKWQLPERWTFIVEVPKTSVGKFDKKVLRTQYADGELAVEEL